jgi:hypothetical protein
MSESNIHAVPVTSPIGKVAPTVVYRIQHRRVTESGHTREGTWSRAFADPAMARAKIEELQRTAAAGTQFRVWKVRSCLAVPEWGFEVVLADGQIVPPDPGIYFAVPVVGTINMDADANGGGYEN